CIQECFKLFCTLLPRRRGWETRSLSFGEDLESALYNFLRGAEIAVGQLLLHELLTVGIETHVHRNLPSLATIFYHYQTPKTRPNFRATLTCLRRSRLFPNGSALTSLVQISA